MTVLALLYARIYAHGIGSGSRETTTMTTKHGLYDADWSQRIGTATRAQVDASEAAAEKDGGSGIITITRSGAVALPGSWEQQQPGVRRVYTLPEAMTLWDAYRLANKRRASLTVTFIGATSIDMGKPSEGHGLSVSPHLVNGNVAFQRGTAADWHFLAPEEARQVVVERPEGRP